MISTVPLTDKRLIAVSYIGRFQLVILAHESNNDLISSTSQILKFTVFVRSSLRCSGGTEVNVIIIRGNQSRPH